MTPLSMIALTSKRVARAVTMSALALGIASSTLLPGVALAAPADRQGSDLHSAILGGDKTYKIGERFDIAVWVQNKGNLAATAKVDFVFGSDIKEARLHWRSSQGWKCGKVTRHPLSQNSLVSCERFNLGANNDIVEIYMEGVVQGNNSHLLVQVDPDEEVGELDETNNTTMKNLR